MKIILVSKCSLDIEKYGKFNMSVLMSPSKSLISSHWVTNIYSLHDIPNLKITHKVYAFENSLSLSITLFQNLPQGV